MISLLWAQFSGWIMAALGLLAACAVAYLKGRGAGKAVEQKKATQRDLDEANQHAVTIRETVDVQAEVSRLPGSDVRERLRKFTRDN